MKEKPQNVNLKLIFYHVLSRFNLRERIHDPVFCYANYFLELTFGFFVKNFQEIKLFICHCSFITLAQKTTVRFLETLQTGYSPFLNIMHQSIPAAPSVDIKLLTLKLIERCNVICYE